MRDPVSINAPYYVLDTGWAVRPDLQLTVQELAVREEGAGEPGQPGDQQQGAGGEQNPPDINNTYLLSVAENVNNQKHL